MKNIKKLIILLFIVVFCFTGCSGTSSKLDETSDYVDNNGTFNELASENKYSSKNEDGSADIQTQGYSEEDSHEDSEPSDEQKLEKNKQETTKAETKKEKLVYKCSMTIETTEYKKTIENINKLIEKYKGIIDSQEESDNDYNWYESEHEKTTGTLQCSMTIRIPSEDYNNFLNEIEGNGKITNKNMNVTNISQTYYDTKATVQSLEIQEDRLLSMLKEAKSIKDMLTIEDRLTDVQTEINQYKTRISNMDTDVAYSTINFDIQEVLEYKPNKPIAKKNHFVDRLKNIVHYTISHFLSTLETLLFAIILMSPYILILLIIAFFFRKKLKKGLKWFKEQMTTPNKKPEKTKTK